MVLVSFQLRAYALYSTFEQGPTVVTHCVEATRDWLTRTFESRGSYADPANEYILRLSDTSTVAEMDHALRRSIPYELERHLHSTMIEFTPAGNGMWHARFVDALATDEWKAYTERIHDIKSEKDWRDPDAQYARRGRRS